MNNRYATSLFLYRNWILVFPAQKLAKLEHSKQNLSNASKKTSEIQNINIWNVFGPTLRILSIKLNNFGSILLWNDPFGAKCHMFQSPVWGGGGRWGQKCFRASYWLNCSQTDLSTDLPMVCKFKFVHYCHMKKKKIVLYGCSLGM